MIGTPTGVCLPGRVGSITLGHGTPTVDMAFPQSIPRGAEGRDEHERHWTVRPPVAQSSCRGGGLGAPAGVDTFVPRALEYGTGERSQRTAVSRGLAAVVVCGT